MNWFHRARLFFSCLSLAHLDYVRRVRSFASARAFIQLRSCQPSPSPQARNPGRLCAWLAHLTRARARKQERANSRARQQSAAASDGGRRAGDGWPLPIADNVQMQQPPSCLVCSGCLALWVRFLARGGCALAVRQPQLQLVSRASCVGWGSRPPPVVVGRVSRWREARVRQPLHVWWPSVTTRVFEVKGWPDALWRSIAPVQLPVAPAQESRPSLHAELGRPGSFLSWRPQNFAPYHKSASAIGEHPSLFSSSSDSFHLALSP